jgi:rod shape-determining protein MreC
MRNLLDFLVKRHFFFLFVAIEIVCFILLYNYNHYHHSRIFTTAGFFTGNLNRAFDNVNDYFSLKQVNENLARENATLRNSLKMARAGMKDTTTLQPEDISFDYINARVVSNTVQRRNNYFMIDKGWADGIKKDMGVVAADGLAGIVIEVTEHFSACISVLHSNMRISARIMKNDHLLSVSWNGISYRLGSLENIPNHVDIAPGDTIITSGNSQIFPKGIMVGTVDNVDDDDGYSFKTATLRYSVDYNRMNFVYVVNNEFKDEIKRLNDVMKDE